MTTTWEFKERFLGILEDCYGRVTHEEAVTLAAEYLSRTEGEKVYPINRPDAPYDMVALLGEELRLYLLDDKMLERENKTVSRNDFAAQAAPLYEFLRSAAGKFQTEPDDDIEKIVFAAVRGLARNSLDDGDIKKVSLRFVSLNETADSPTMRVVMRFGVLLVEIYVANLAFASSRSVPSPLEVLEEIGRDTGKELVAKRETLSEAAEHKDVGVNENEPDGDRYEEPEETSFESYDEFKDGVLGLAEQGPKKDRFQNLLPLVARILELTTWAKPGVAADPETPYDLVASKSGSLYFYLIDREAFDREEESLGMDDYRDRLVKLVEFIRAVREGRPVLFPDYAHPGVPELIREIRNPPGGQATCLKLCLLSFNPIYEEAGRAVRMIIGELGAVVACRSIWEMWPAKQDKLSNWLQGEAQRVGTRNAVVSPVPPSQTFRSIPTIGTTGGISSKQAQTPETSSSSDADEKASAPAPSVGESAEVARQDRKLRKVSFDGPQIETEPAVVNTAVGAPSKSEAGSAANADDFRERILREASVGISHYSLFGFVKDTFTEAQKYEEVIDAPCYDKNCGGRTVAVDGYAFDESNGVLTLILLDDDMFSAEPSQVLKADYEEQIEKLRSFFGLASDGTLIRDYIDVNTDEGNCAYNIQYWFDQDQISRVEYVLVTMGRNSMRKNAKPLEGKYNGIKWSAQLVDYVTLYELAKTDPTPRIDFREIAPEDTVLLLQTVDEQAGYSAYVGRIAASTLAEIYDRYGQRVLSGNVRAFLSSTNKVNKGMLETIQNERDTFFAYNNGVCIVAEAIETEQNNGVVRLLKAVDFQIVNGGQTTATLHYARTKKEFDLQDIYVQMKLTVMPRNMDADKRLMFVKNVSKYANSQSKVQDSDLGANTLFQIAFKRASQSPRCMFIPSGHRVSYYWYYERSRGSYKVEHIKDEASKSQVAGAKFDDRYPKDCKFDKTDLAKWILTFAERPHTVSHGGQKCYLAFSKRVDEIERVDPELKFVTPEFVKYCIGKGLVFRLTDEIVRKSRWYKENRSYKANIVTYALALLTRLIRKHWGENASLDFMSFATKQSAPESLYGIFDTFAEMARRSFNDPNRTVDDVGEWVKKLDCWVLLKTYRTSLTAEEIEALAPYVVEVDEPIKFDDKKRAKAADEEEA